MTIRFRNLNTFQKALRQFGDNVVPEDAKRLQQKVGLDLLRRIIFKTPIDTGRARGNWQTSTGPSNDSEVDNFDADVALADGAAAVAGLQPFGVIRIFNNVKYIRLLEEGSSRQAPTGMVKVSIAETNSQFPG